MPSISLKACVMGNQALLGDSVETSKNDWTKTWTFCNIKAISFFEKMRKRRVECFALFCQLCNNIQSRHSVIWGAHAENFSLGTVDDRTVEQMGRTDKQTLRCYCTRESCFLYNVHTMYCLLSCALSFIQQIFPLLKSAFFHFFPFSHLSIFCALSSLHLGNHKEAENVCNLIASGQKNNL